MIIIADENIDRHIIIALRQASYKVISIAEDYKGISDEDVIGITMKLQGILLTCDKDFGEWVFAHGRMGFSVLFLRYEKEETNEIIRNIILIVEKIALDEHSFISITKNKIRQRKI